MRRAWLLVVLLLFACTAGRAPHIPRPGWRSAALPIDPRGRDEIRAVAACGGRWYAAGAILARDGSTVPAMWASDDGRSFTALPIEARSYYGQSNTLSTVACHGTDVVAVGASSGGAHGNLRTSTWRSTDGGPLIEHPVGLGVFGGPDAVGVGSITAGAGGFVIVGARIDAAGGVGAAVWTSPDGETFTLRDNDPALESDATIGGTEVDAAAPAGSGFVAVGGVTPPGSPLAARDPIAWTSPDGASWHRVTFPHSASDDLLQAVSGETAIGPAGPTFRAWSTGTGRRLASFGSIAVGGEVPGVSSLVGMAAHDYAVIQNGTDFQMWRSSGSRWERVALPVDVAAAPVRSGPRVVCAAALGTTLMLATDDGSRARVWFAGSI